MDFRKRQRDDFYDNSRHGPVAPRKGGKGKGKGFADFDDSSNKHNAAAIFEIRIPIVAAAFAPQSDILSQVLGPRGIHQQRMRAESDAVVTCVGKEGSHEPIALLVRSQQRDIPLTPRQIAVVQTLLEDLMRHVSEFGSTDEAGREWVHPREVPPSSIVAFLWNVHLLLACPAGRPTAAPIRVSDFYPAYFDEFRAECPLPRWLVVDPNAGGVAGALGRVPHIVELFDPTEGAEGGGGSVRSGSVRQGSGGLWMRATNGPAMTFSQMRELDDQYKAFLQGHGPNPIHAPLAADPEPEGPPAQAAAAEERFQAMCTMVQAVQRVLTERCPIAGSSLSLETLPLEFMDLFKSPLDVYTLFQEASLLRFVQKFPAIFQVFYDGSAWRVLLNTEQAHPDIGRAVNAAILHQRRPRSLVRIAALVGPPPNAQGSMGAAHPQEAAPAAANGDSLAALVSILQGFQKQPTSGNSHSTQSNPAPLQVPAAQPVRDLSIDTTNASSSVTAQIQQLLMKKKQKQAEVVAPKPAEMGGSAAALNDLMAALAAAKSNK